MSSSSVQSSSSSLSASDSSAATACSGGSGGGSCDVRGVDLALCNCSSSSLMRSVAAANACSSVLCASLNARVSSGSPSRTSASSSSTRSSSSAILRSELARAASTLQRTTVAPSAAFRSWRPLFR
eukprot:CAMPEP_0181213110 /NCGR_PEP_ID=MMETSP1096-20121128/24722_1 /TAXON_ID=156174 ORGANISM="Chrysochromulina ericina, Strain CCMP281" /NCGR_SAMPLE_ID=MMETSP1096 /ASSEMBLY_ACC=CAM_ASM_000453 /LENGTH=125 /DNA_ID=CAMNT_0023304711 /DNA_START=1028 /DNA_END=1401 /DNA_ORIENTATION=+